MTDGIEQCPYCGVMGGMHFAGCKARPDMLDDAIQKTHAAVQALIASNDRRGRLLKWMLEMFDDAANADNACMGYKDREKLLRLVQEDVGLPFDVGPMPNHWRNGGVSDSFHAYVVTQEESHA